MNRAAPAPHRRTAKTITRPNIRDSVGVALSRRRARSIPPRRENPVNRFAQIALGRRVTVAAIESRRASATALQRRLAASDRRQSVLEHLERGGATKAATRPSRRRDDRRPAAADEANVQNLARDRRAKPSREMQRRAVAYRRQHGLGEPRVVRPAAARPREDDSRLADDGAVPREAHANRDLIVVVRRTPAGGDPRRNAMDAGDQRRLRLDGCACAPSASATIRSRRSGEASDGLQASLPL